MVEGNDIEDLVLAPLHVNGATMSGMMTSEKDQKKVVKLVMELVSNEYDSKAEFAKTVERLKMKNSLGVKTSEISRVYQGLVKAGYLELDPMVELFLRTKAGKSASGILSITVFTSPRPKFTTAEGKTKTQKFTCEWNCYYCPDHPDHARSYLPDEPGCLRAERCGFDAIRQLAERVATLRAIGHPVDKLEVLVLGGTWESYPREYQRTFIRDLFYAANTFFDLDPKRDPLTLAEEQLINETTKVKIIGLTLETRPDTVNAEAIRLFREYGCTRLQIGVQHIEDRILDKINRKHSAEQSATALRLLANNCFKVDIHIMPDLPGASPEIDQAMFDSLLGVNNGGGDEQAAVSEFVEGIADQYFEYDLVNPGMQADQWKIYPCEVTPWTVIEKWFKAGTYVPYGGGDGPLLLDLLCQVKTQVFPWIRLNRIIRDIPNQHILGGNDNTNMRQAIQAKLKADGRRCKCIRCREVGLNNFSRAEAPKAQLIVRKYNAHGGTEYFISFESRDRTILYGFLRLRLCDNSSDVVFDVLEGSALIRELHVYGQMIPTYSKRNKLEAQHQHVGFGRRLMAAAEAISKRHGRSRISVIAGIGTREYYRGLGYKLQDTYLVKSLEDSNQSLWIVLALLAVILGLIINWNL